MLPFESSMGSLMLQEAERSNPGRVAEETTSATDVVLCKVSKARLAAQYII
jgi:hypothetical protein